MKGIGTSLGAILPYATGADERSSHVLFPSGHMMCSLHRLGRLLDLTDGSDTLPLTFADMAIMSRALIRGWALPLAVLLLMFCLSAAPPAVAEEPACGGLDSSERVCAQSGTSTPIFAVAHELIPIQTLDLPGIPLSPDGASSEPAQHHADLSTPRAPPSLA